MLKNFEKAKIEKNFNLSISDWNMLSLAFMHKSYINENLSKGKVLDWELLNFLGHELYALLTADLGFFNVSQDRAILTTLNGDLASNGLRHRILDFYNCYDFVKMGKGAKKNDNLRAETLLAPILAVIYLEHGYEKSYQWIKPVYLQLVKEYQEEPNIDWKTSLQQWVQSKKGKVEYQLISEEGPAHLREHLVELNALGKRVMGKGKKKKDAEQEAAKQFHTIFIPKDYWNKQNQLQKYKPYEVNIPDKRRQELHPLLRFFSASDILLNQSLTHTSIFHEKQNMRKLEYSPLAYLGSYVYAFVFANLIYKNFYKLFSDESLIVVKNIFNSIRNQSEILKFIDSLGLKLDDLLICSKGLRKTGIVPSIKVDSFQALFGAHFVNSRVKDGRVSLSKLEELVEIYFLSFTKTYNGANYLPINELQDFIQRLPGNWVVNFNNTNISNYPKPVNLAKLQIKRKGFKMYEWSAQANTSGDARNLAAKKALHDIYSALNFLDENSSSSQSQFQPLIDSYFNGLLSFSKARGKVNKQLELSGGLGISKFINNRFAAGYVDVFTSLSKARNLGANLNVRLLDIYKVFRKDFRLNQINFKHMTDYINDLSEWLDHLDFNSNPHDVDRFFDDIVDSIQIFRHISRNELGIIPINHSVQDILLVKPHSINLKVNTSKISEVYGNDAFLKSFFYNILSKLDECKHSNVNKMDVEIHIRSKSRNMTQVVIQYEGVLIDQNRFQTSLVNISQLASISFAQMEINNSEVLFTFVNPFKNMGLNEDDQHTIESLFMWLNNILIENIKDLGPVGGVVHDLKNALTSLKSYLYLYKKTKKINTQLFALRDTCINKANILKTFFSVNSASYSHVDLLEFSSFISKDLKVLAQGRCRFNLSIGLINHEVITDSSLLYSIITNLVKNAIESIDNENGEVNLTVKMDYEDELIITIEDNGCGIDPSRIPLLFSSFYSNKERFKGSGLGLPTVKRYVEILGGIIEVHSEIGVGSKFEILLPVQVEDKELIC
jgi:ribonuclease III